MGQGGKIKYKALILDHDDTVVDSTATVHYPAFVAYMTQLKGGTDITLEDYFSYNLSPGVVPFFQKIVGLNTAEMQAEEAFWREYVSHHIPEVYPGIKELLESFREEGGIITVISHSFSDYIRRDYEAGGLPMPDMIFGWETPPERRKPKPHCVWEILERFKLKPEEVLVVDDLKPGYDMACSAGVPFAAAAWAGDYPVVAAFMQAKCERYLKTVEELAALVL